MNEHTWTRLIIEHLKGLGAVGNDFKGIKNALLKYEGLGSTHCWAIPRKHLAMWNFFCFCFVSVRGNLSLKFVRAF
jgi:hypothetical protein